MTSNPKKHLLLVEDASARSRWLVDFKDLVRSINDFWPGAPGSPNESGT